MNEKTLITFIVNKDINFGWCTNEKPVPMTTT